MPIKKSRFTEEQIVFALKQAELGTAVPEVCLKLDISDATFYTLRQKYGGISPSELKHMRQLEEENLRLSRVLKGSSTAKFSIAAGLVGRQLVVFDSFRGLPAHNEDHGMSIEGREVIFQEGDFSGSLEEVRHNVTTYGDIDACTFVPGWFEDTMKNCPSPVAAAYLDVDPCSVLHISEVMLLALS